MRRRTVFMAGLALAFALWPAAASAVPPACGGTVQSIQSQISTLVAPVRQNPRLSQGKGAADLQTKVARVFAAARQEHPECKAEIDQVARALQSASGQRATGAHAKGFLGPIGWLWNNIYYRVFQGNSVMMAIFGWELFLSPVILVLAGAAVLRGVGGALHPPEVPENVRTA